MTPGRIKAGLDLLVTLLLLTVALWMLAPKVMPGRPNPSEAIAPGREQQAFAATTLVRWYQEGERIGPVDAEIKIIEFANLLCGFCAKYHAVFDTIAERYPGMLSLTWMHFVPAGNGANDARRFSLAAECAGEQGRFAEFVDESFSAPSRIGSAAQLRGLAAKAGVTELSQFDSCVATSKYAAEVDGQSDEARVAGFDGTPTWLANGELFAGAPTAAMLDSIIATKLRRVSR